LCGYSHCARARCISFDCVVYAARRHRPPRLGAPSRQRPLPVGKGGNQAIPFLAAAPALDGSRPQKRARECANNGQRLKGKPAQRHACAAAEASS